MSGLGEFWLFPAAAADAKVEGVMLNDEERVDDSIEAGDQLLCGGVGPFSEDLDQVGKGLD